MTQRVYLKLEKKLACDLKPGELFVMEHVPPNEMSGPNPALATFLRTNAPSDEFADMDVMVYKVHVVITDPDDPAPPKVNPHAPPGMKNGP